MKYPIGTILDVALPDNMRIGKHEIKKDSIAIRIGGWCVYSGVLQDKFIYLGDSMEKKLHMIGVDSIIVSLFKTESNIAIGTLVELPTEIIKETGRITDIRELPPHIANKAILSLIKREPGYLIAHKNKDNTKTGNIMEFVKSIRKNVPALSFIDGVKSYIEALLHCSYKPTFYGDAGQVYVTGTSFECVGCYHNMSVTEIATLVEQQTELNLIEGQKPVFRFLCPSCGNEYIIKSKDKTRHATVIRADNTDIAQIQTIHPTEADDDPWEEDTE